MVEKESDFIAAVIARPADDQPRLMYADWLLDNDQSTQCPECRGCIFKRLAQPGSFRLPVCESCRGVGRIGNGYAARSAFIRTQCFLAKLRPCPRCDDTGAAILPGQRRCGTYT
jgi:uncharacterized protein (TIGR02996 family)